MGTLQWVFRARSLFSFECFAPIVSECVREYYVGVCKSERERESEDGANEGSVGVRARVRE